MGESKDSSNETKEFKRKRTAHACEECRSRKSRCDGGQPVCDKCSEMGFFCRYKQPRARNSASVSPFQLLEGSADSWLAGRLDNMERLLGQLISKTHTVTPPYLPNSPPETLSMQSIQSNDHVDGMGCMTFGDEADAGHFGPTSNASFLHHIMTAVDKLPRSRPPHSYFDNALPASQPEWPSLNNPTNKSPSIAQSVAPNPPDLTSPERTTILLQHYFHNTGVMFPYLHRDTILSYLNHDHHPRLEDLPPVQRCLISTCLAFANVHGNPDQSGKENLQSARRYFDIAKSTLPEILSNRCNVETVQALLLVLQYSQGTQHSSETWGLLGAIVQRAFQIGLYRPAPPSGMTPLNMGIRARTWWMVFMMDKMCSMTFGRPPLIPNSYMESKLPSTITFGLGRTACGQSEENGVPDNLTGADLFLQTCKLNLILGDVIETIYGSNIEIAPPPGLLQLQQNIIRIEGRLLEWKNQLPSPFQYLDLAGRDKIGHFQLPGRDLHERRTIIVLSLRYLNLRSLLHRATIYQLLDLPSGRQECDELHSLQSSVNICIESAVNSIKIISHAVKQRDVLPIWWFSAYYTLTASLTVFAAITLSLKEPTHLQPYTIHELLATLQTALSSLDGLEQDSLVVYRCQLALRRIISTCWAVTGQYLPESPSVHQFSRQNTAYEAQSGTPLGSADSLSHGSSYTYVPFTDTTSLVESQVDLDFSWVHSLAENLQAFNGDF